MLWYGMHVKAMGGKCLSVKTDVKPIPLQAQQSPGRHQRQAEAAFGVRIERLNQELSAKTRTIQELSRTVARLQKERISAPSVPSPRPETRSVETKRQPCPTKTCGGEETFPAAQYEKTYQPTVFAGGMWTLCHGQLCSALRETE